MGENLWNAGSSQYLHTTEKVEGGGLANIWQADDSHFDVIACSRINPSAPRMENMLAQGRSKLDFGCDLGVQAMAYRRQLPFSFLVALSTMDRDVSEMCRVHYSYSRLMQDCMFPALHSATPEGPSWRFGLS